LPRHFAGHPQEMLSMIVIVLLIIIAATLLFGAYPVLFALGFAALLFVIWWVWDFLQDYESIGMLLYILTVLGASAGLIHYFGG
jgi:hypothetical protein